MEDTVYQELWNLDSEHNGLSTSARKPSGEWHNPNAEILLDEQNRYTQNVDKAPNPLFYYVDNQKIKSPTYETFELLLDNYLINPNDPEDDLEDSFDEWYETELFLEEIMKTPVMKQSYKIVKDLGNDLSELEYIDQIRKMWFEPYDNFYKGKKTSDCIGFEHIFIGEGKKSNSDGIGGYHYWYKYFLDEISGRVDFKGYNYGNSQNQSKGAQNAHVATISMEWLTNDSRNNLKLKRKDKGGFFVGLSPEGQIALATVLYFEHNKYPNKFKGNTHRAVSINGHDYDLVLYKETLKNSSNNTGTHLRSFFPIYKKPSEVSIDTDKIIIEGDSSLIITKALINPEGYDKGVEWVEVMNNSDKKISLENWSITNKLNEKMKLHGHLDPKKKTTIIINVDNFRLTNKNEGFIGLYNSISGNTEVKVQYSNIKVNETLYFEQ